MTCGIYKIVHTRTGRAYVGSSMYIERREKEHWGELTKNRHVNPILQNAWNCHGSDAFHFEVIECCEEARLWEREQWWIDRIGFYNCSQYARAGRRTGFTHTDETKAKMSAVRKGVPKSEETKRRMSEGLRGRTFTDEHRANISASRRGRSYSRRPLENTENVARAGRKASCTRWSINRGKPCVCEMHGEES